ncbi:MAG TPA: hypothetical protein VJ804_08830 [Acidimicrobiales bacterium]|nr:hypothetical protein [Acidimicrobiales bacterium]
MARRRRHRRRWTTSVAALIVLVGVGVMVAANDDTSEPAVLSSGPEDDASIPGEQLPVIGTETIATSGMVGDVRWELVAYRTTATEDGLERVCSELRTPAYIGPQSCLPVDPGRLGGWAFVEYVAGAPLIVVAAAPGNDVTVDGTSIPGLNHDLGLPVRLGAHLLEGDGPFTMSTGSIVSLLSVVPHGDGTRQPVATPALTGIFWERLTSDDPAQDGWIPVATSPVGQVGYLNPVDYLLRDVGAIPGEEPDPVDPPPIYDAEGHRIGWLTCGSFSTERERSCEDVDVTTTVGPEG